METGPIRRTESKVEILKPEVRREALLRRGREGLQAVPFDPVRVKNQEQLGRAVDDAAAVVKVHAGVGNEALGVRETTTRHFAITVDGEVIIVKAEPTVVNKWISYPDMPAKFLTQEQAKNTPYAGKTALEWAAHGGKIPECVVQVGGQFYPATPKDIIVTTEFRYRK